MLMRPTAKTGEARATTENKSNQTMMTKSTTVRPIAAVLSVLCLSLLLLLCPSTTAFAPSTPASNRQLLPSTSSSSTQLFFFGAAKDDGSPGDYVCKDCGYVFTKGPKAWAALSEKTYQCPPCGAPKFRFKKVPKGSASGKVAVKKSWF